MTRPFTRSPIQHGATPDRETTTCCAKCMRGTRALLGPCGYDGACVCHTNRVRDSAGMDSADGLVGAKGMKVAVEGDSGRNSYISGRSREEQ